MKILIQNMKNGRMKLKTSLKRALQEQTINHRKKVR